MAGSRRSSSAEADQGRAGSVRGRELLGKKRKFSGGFCANVPRVFGING